ncbi:MAG: hypothetical protein SH848_09010 [Saprospiraceae bacterium]|nr:hypothetical protein [Saprospiraceae bacterium]MDZ4704056.1 hypothetical protein [Saprospiraceae bacterium]
MYKFLSSNGQVLAFGLGALLSVLFLVSWLGGQESLNALPDDEKFKTGIFDAGILGATALVFIAALMLVGFGLYQTATDFKKSLKSIIGVVALILVFIIAYSTSTPDKTGMVGDAAIKMGVSDNTQKLIGGGLTTMYIMMGLSLLALAASEIRNIFK